MELHVLKPRKALNKAFLKVKPKRSEIERFKAGLIQLLDRTNDIESEEFHKNLVIDFLKKTYYDPNHFINTKGRTDLVIHNGNTAKSTVGVIIETKKPTSKNEMLRLPEAGDTPEQALAKINVKAFQELVLYYMRERILQNNNEIKYLIATNINEWFIFDSSVFERNFVHNKAFVKKFNDFENHRLADFTTEFFYNDVAEPFIRELNHNIEYTYFNIRDYEKPLRNNDPRDDNKLIALYKLLSPEHLLKLPFLNDSNSLDKRFYGELLHIIGLTERKQGSKKVIERNKEGERHTGALLENAINQLDARDKISRLPDTSAFGDTYQEQLFNVGLELIITWINRILFLKLLEAQLVNFHKGDETYKFLNIKRIKDFDGLDNLFFQVLARKHDARTDEAKTRFQEVPYLNSSLFEPTEIEQITIFISNLRNERTIPVYASTVLQDNRGRKRTGELSALEYLFKFLDAYDFSSESSEKIQEENKSLINASVLGLIFEKINGYKDGSFFTPGFITMYMSRETIRRAVVQKFNEVKGWNCENLNDVYNKIEDPREANNIINSLKICDPAVGSGHFLVSALNEIIAIKNDLRILQDRQDRRLKEYSFEVANDELVITDEDGAFFEYHPQNKESQRVQEALFHEKQTIIENCLFGVDINPNSVKICRLRLWIELLKNAYYKNEKELETLPNIDINIKKGNSLISRFALDADLKQALKKTGNKWTVDDYRIAVDTYRNAQSKEQKHEMERLINEIKTNFRSEISANDPKVKRLQKVNGEIFNMTNQMQLLEKTEKQIVAWNKNLEKLTTESLKLEREIEDIKNNKIYENAFEWRFEFPEILDDNGDFMGFDVVIGNPPYGVSIKGQERSHMVANVSKVPDYEIYYWFIDRSHQLLKQRGDTSYIIPNSILFNVYAKEYRLKLFDNWCIEEMLDCTDINIFEDATVRNVIFQFVKGLKCNKLNYRPTKGITSFEVLKSHKLISVKKDILISNNQNWGLVFKLSQKVVDIIAKIKTHTIPLSKLFPETSQGLIAYDKYRGQSDETIKNRVYHHFSNPNNMYKRWIYGEDIVRYGVKWNGKEYIDYCEGIANPREPKYFLGKRLLIREITNPRIFAAITTDELYNDPSVLIVKENQKSFSLEALLAIFNSKLATFYHFNSSPKATKGAFPKILVYDVNNFPLPIEISKETDNLLKSLVVRVIESKRANKNSNTSSFESQIDQLVYQLYGLTEEEIEMIEKNIKQ